MTKAELIKILDRSSLDDAKIRVIDKDGIYEVAYIDYAHSTREFLIVAQASPIRPKD